MTVPTGYISWLEDLGMGDVGVAGGKNASLGELLRELGSAGIRVPGGFAILVSGYRELLSQGDLAGRIEAEVDTYHAGACSLNEAGRRIRSAIRSAPLPPDLASAIANAYAELARRTGVEPSVAVRSSATAEDLPGASFAGQQETYLNVVGADELLEACSLCYASLFTDRAIVYRDEQGFDHMDVGLSIGVQVMVRADLGGSGVMFSRDTETGFPGVVLINAAWGLGETVVQGAVNPDEYYVHKPGLEKQGCVPIIQRRLGDKATMMVYDARHHGQRTQLRQTPRPDRDRFVLSDAEVLTLARWAVAVEDHYGGGMDIEWARDGREGELYVVQARPETVQSQRTGNTLTTYRLDGSGRVLAEGRSVGGAIASGPVCRIESPRDIEHFRPGSVLVTEMTDPDWVPIMQQARAIVTDLGGRTCHAAIISRELGVPAIVGTINATSVLPDGAPVTVSCASGETGYVYEGELPFTMEEVSLLDVPETQTEVMVNLAVPEGAFGWHALPADGIGLARTEFIFTNTIKIHPLALVHYDELEEGPEREQIDALTRGYPDRKEFLVERLAEGVATLAATFYPKPVIVRLSDFKSNEYAALLGGSGFEPEEDNPMIGFRGASRYYSELYRPGFDLECAAMNRARELMGLDNLRLMVPFCRTLEEADRVLAVMEENGLRRGENGLQVYVMAELPSNIVLAREFAERFDGFSIGSNDLTQLTLGIDRDSALLAELFDERNPAVTRQIERLIEAAHESGKHVGLCGQAPSDHPEFAEFLVRCGIDSISLNPDQVVPVKRLVARVEAELAEER